MTPGGSTKAGRVVGGVVSDPPGPPPNDRACHSAAHSGRSIRARLRFSANCCNSLQFRRRPGRPVASWYERTWWWDSSTPRTMRSAVVVVNPINTMMSLLGSMMAQAPSMILSNSRCWAGASMAFTLPTSCWSLHALLRTAMVLRSEGLAMDKRSYSIMKMKQRFDGEPSLVSSRGYTPSGGILAWRACCRNTG